MAGAGGDAFGGGSDCGDFMAGERVFVPHVDRHYEAKILKAEWKVTAEMPDGAWHYFLHYSGWNKKYDEWVPSAGLVKASELGLTGAPPPPHAAAGGGGGGGGAGGGSKSGSAANRKLPKERFAAATGALGGAKKARLAADLSAIGGPTVGGAGGMGGGGGGGGGPGAAAPGAGPAGAGAGDGTTSAGGAAGGAAASRGLQLELDISPVLKKALLDDYDAVVTDGKLTPLPRSPCVAEVLRRYCDHAAEVAGSAAAHTPEAEVAAGLRTYFDKALMAVLLYRSERPQAMALLADGRLPSSCYGTEHLLRLFVKLPDLLSTAGAAAMNEDMLVTTAVAVQDLMNWVAEHLEGLLAPREAYLDHYTFVAGLSGEVAEAVAAAGFAGTTAPPQQRATAAV